MYSQRYFFATVSTKLHLLRPLKAAVSTVAWKQIIYVIFIFLLYLIFHDRMCSRDRYYNQLWSVAGWSTDFKLQFHPAVLCGG